jgi:hypothetical protein
MTLWYTYRIDISDGPNFYNRSRHAGIELAAGVLPALDPTSSLFTEILSVSSDASSRTAQWSSLIHAVPHLMN